MATEQLTEGKILARTKLSLLSDVRNLNLWGSDLSDVRILRSLPNVEVLSLSVNRITSLVDLSACHALRELYLRKNQISDLHEILHLRGLRHLRILWLSENPCCSAPGYREFILRELPQLEKLDNTDVTADEREVALKRTVSGGAEGMPLRAASIDSNDFLSPRSAAMLAAQATGSRFAPNSPSRREGRREPSSFDSDSVRGGDFSPHRSARGAPAAPLSPSYAMRREEIEPATYSIRRDESQPNSPRSSRGRDRAPLSPRRGAGAESNPNSPRRFEVRRSHDFGGDEQPSPRSSASDRVPRLAIPSSVHSAAPPMSPTSHRLVADAAEESAARAKARVLEQEIELLRQAEDTERARERAYREGSSRPVVQHSPPRSSRPLTAAPLTPTSAARAAEFVSGSQSARGGAAAGLHHPFTSNHAYGEGISASSRPVSARPAAGEKRDPFPAFARGERSRPLTAVPQVAETQSRESNLQRGSAVLSPLSERPSSPPLSQRYPPAPHSSLPPSAAVAMTPRSHAGGAPPASQHNLLCAVFAMMHELDANSLTRVAEEVEQRLKAHRRK